MEVVYAETSIFSFYHEIRREPDMVVRRRRTRKWWDEYAVNYQVVISQYVIDELKSGEYPTKADTVKMLDGLTLLKDLTGEIFRIVSVYVDNRLMPGNDLADAWHLAMASYHECHYLLTWNCTHLANANKFEHIRKINTRLGLSVPRLVTPDDLLEEARNV